MKKITSFTLALFFSLLLAPSDTAASTQVNALIEKLVEKGILTKAESVEITAEIAAEEKIIQEENLKQSVPEWVQKLKLKGDFRLRYQYEQNQHASEHRDRARIRYRLGLETMVNNTTKVGAGLSSGGTDPRSTNQTLDNSFERPDIRLDYAYAEWEPLKGNKAVGGKFVPKDYLWAPTDLLWDSDINPTGGSVHLERDLISSVDGYLNFGAWIIDENGTTDRIDPFMNVAQGGFKWKNENAGLSANAAATYYAFHGVKGTDLDNERNANTQTGGLADSTLRYDYDSIGTSAEFGIDHPLGVEQVEQLAFFGDYIYNLGSGDDNAKNEIDDGWGWAAGARLGHKKITSRGHWQLKYIFALLQKDAWPDVFPDSDRKGGDTDIKSHETIFEYGLNKNVSLVLDYYQTKKLRAAEGTEHLFQADINLKF